MKKTGRKPQVPDAPAAGAEPGYCCFGRSSDWAQALSTDCWARQVASCW